MRHKEQFERKSSGTVTRVLVYALVLSLTLPLPMLEQAMAQGADDGKDHVLRRLNSPERAAAIAEAVRKDAAMRAASSSVIPAQAGIQSSTPSATTQNGRKALDPRLRGDDGVQVGASGASASTASGAAFRPKTVSEVLFNGFAGFMGVPGLTPQRDINGNYDEGLGFHQDGTVRKAGGSDNTLTPDGRRAAAYAGSGLDAGYRNGLREPGYDPVTGMNFRYGDPTAGGRISGQNGMGRAMDSLDPSRMALDRGLSYGLGLANSAGEAALSGLVDGGRARLNFSVDWDGRINGESDVLLPFYDSQYTTIYTQLGARSMSGISGGDRDDGQGADRWIGNAGLGQRWFPQAQSLTDSGNWMLGYNAFYDYDFTRSHQRGGLGIEAQYDWLRLASNYYFPISSWRDSKDFDGDFVKERAAEGWDLRAKGYLPFYRNVAVTGAYSQWYGDHVGMFSSDKLEKDPKVWSYGVEYTPVPLVSGFLTQRQTERGRSDTEVGLRFTYHFQMPWEDQISHSKVAQLRTVSGSRHEFVDRENKIILEYKAKNSYRITYLGQDGENRFRFRVTNGFDEYMAGQTVRVTAGGVTLAEAKAPAPDTFLAKAGEFLSDLFSVREAHAADFSQTYTTDRNGEFVVAVANTPGGPVVLTIQAGENTQAFTVLTTATLKLSVGANTLSNGTGTTATLQGIPGATVSWSVSGPATLSGQQGQTNGQGIATATVQASPTGHGDIVVTATVNGNAVNATINVPQVYALEAAPNTIALADTKPVVFTLKMNGQAVPNKAVTLAYSGAGEFTTPSANATTNASGTFTLTLTGKTQGAVTVTATVDGKTVPCSMTVGAIAATATLSASPASITVGGTAALTVQLAGVTPLTGQAVAWSIVSGSGFGALSAPQTATDATGKATATLAGSAAGTVKVKAVVTVNGTPVEATVDVTVTAAVVPPTVEVVTTNSPADNSSLNKVRAKFFGPDGLTPVADGTSVAWSLPSPLAGVSLTAATSTVSGGWAEMTVKDGGAGNRDVSVRATYNGLSGDITVHFGAPVLTLGALSASPANPAVGNTSSVTGNVTFADGSPAANLPSTAITWTTRNNASASATPTTATSGTNAAGAATFTATSDVRHVMYVQATAGTSSVNTTVQFGAALPTGFIALAPGTMPWSDAGSYCASHGGKLPRINDSTSWDGSNMSSATIDGFGTPMSSTWPSGLPGHDYWTGTENSSISGYSWAVYDDAVFRVYVDSGGQGNSSRVVCVP